MNKLKKIIIGISLSFAMSCDNGREITPTSNGNQNAPGWSIPADEVLSGGPGKDGIPALIDSPTLPLSEVNFLTDSSLVVGYKVGDDARAYPHRILDYHEIANDQLGNEHVAITYCPLTGSAIGWNRNLNGETTTFGVSGLLYNSNLIPYDRLTDSNWSQMKGESVNGDLLGSLAEKVQLIETTWETWQDMYPNSVVLSEDTANPRPYDRYPYTNLNGEDYRVDPFLIFPVSFDDKRLPRKERVLGIISGNTSKVYSINDFPEENTVIYDNFYGVNIVVIGNSKKNFAVSFENILADRTQLVFAPVEDKGDIIMKDNEGNEWNIFGEAVSGPRIGEHLRATNSFIGYWFAFGTFHNDPIIHSF